MFHQPHFQTTTGLACNQCSIETLFAKYAEVGFLYPAKMDLLRPYFKLIKSNWHRLLYSHDDLLWILTNQDKRHFASISVIKHANHGLMAQHLVSDGNPRLSLQLMAEAQRLVERVNEKANIKAAQNWFRPNNRYAYRVFASMIDQLGHDKASLITFEYLKLPLHDIQAVKSFYRAEVVEAADPELTDFVAKQYNPVFCQGEELDSDDLNFTKLGQQFRRVGLRKGRKIIKLTNPFNQQIVACVIANRAPVGLNFSFLENRAYFIVDPSLSEMGRQQVIKELSQSIKPYYADFELQAIPIVTNAATSGVLQEQGAEHLRTYMQSIWLKAGFAQWRAHIEGFLQRIERRVR
ncbi:MAG: hypothetical protein AAF828_03900 [Bacteroidota bacterium]